MNNPVRISHFTSPRTQSVKGEQSCSPLQLSIHYAKVRSVAVKRCKIRQVKTVRLVIVTDTGGEAVRELRTYRAQDADGYAGHMLSIIFSTGVIHQHRLQEYFVALSSAKCF